MDGFLFPRPGSKTWLKVLASWRLQNGPWLVSVTYGKSLYGGGFPKMVDTPKMEGENNGTTPIKMEDLGEKPTIYGNTRI